MIQQPLCVSVGVSNIEMLWHDKQDSWDTSLSDIQSNNINQHVVNEERREWVRERGCDSVVVELDKLFLGSMAND